MSEKITSRTAWMIERNSKLWGTEWFCAGGDRWTKDPNMTIQFPDETSAKEIWEAFGNEVLPCSLDTGEWVYTMSATEHSWIQPDPLTASEIRAEVEKLRIGYTMNIGDVKYNKALDDMVAILSRRGVAVQRSKPDNGYRAAYDPPNPPEVPEIEPPDPLTASEIRAEVEKLRRDILTIPNRQYNKALDDVIAILSRAFFEVNQ